MCFLEVGERLRECVGVVPGYAGVFTWVRGAVLRGGGADLSECLVEDVKICALTEDVSALAGREPPRLGVPAGEFH